MGQSPQNGRFSQRAKTNSRAGNEELAWHLAHPAAIPGTPDGSPDPDRSDPWVLQSQESALSPTAGYGSDKEQAPWGAGGEKWALKTGMMVNKDFGSKI